MTATANGKDILNAVITEPRVGAWSVEFDVDSDEALQGKVNLVVDGVTWVGTVMRGDTNAGRAHARVVGGAGRLGTLLPAKYYLGVTLGTVLADLMKATGETLSTRTDPAVSSRTVPRWTRSQALAGQALRQVADGAGVSWRVLRDGTIWLGKDIWSPSQVVYEEIDQEPSQGSITIAPVAPHLAPGTKFQGKPVSRVTTHVSAAGLRQEALFEDGTEAGGHGRVTRDVAAVVEAFVGNRIDYARFYPSRVVRQSPDNGTLELLPDDPKMRGNGVTQVPIRHGIPGVTVKVPANGRVLLFFENGDCQLPAAALWPDGSSVTELKIVAPTVIIDGDLQVTGEVTARSQTTKIALSSHEHLTAMGPSDVPTPTP